MVYEKNIPMNLYLGRHLINLNVPNKIAQKLIGVHVNVAKAFQALLLSYHYRNKFYCTVEFNRYKRRKQSGERWKMFSCYKT